MPSAFEDLFVASHEGDHETVRQLLFHPDLDINQGLLPPGTTALFTACFEGHVEVVKLLLSHPEIAVNKTQDEGASPFFAACQEGHLEVVKLLLADPRVDVNQPMMGNVTPLFMVCQGGYLEIARLMLADERVDTTRPTDDGGTPLFISCQEGHAEVVKMLLKDPEVMRKGGKQTIVDGQSILSVVCEKNRLEVLKLLMLAEVNPGDLLDYGASISREKANEISIDEVWLELLDEIDKEEILPRELAEAQGFDELLKLLDDYQRDRVGVIERLRVETGIAEQYAAELFATVVFLSDAHLTFPAE